DNPRLCWLDQMGTRSADSGSETDLHPGSQRLVRAAVAVSSEVLRLALAHNEYRGIRSWWVLPHREKCRLRQLPADRTQPWRCSLRSKRRPPQQPTSAVRNDFVLLIFPRGS